MSGRYFTIPLFISVILLSRTDFSNFTRLNFKHSKILVLIIGCIVILGVFSPDPPILTGYDYGKNTNSIHNQIADEREHYYQATGLLRENPENETDFVWAELGVKAKESGMSIVIFPNIGFFGWNAGPDIHIVDQLALGDPLLARIPVEPSPHWMTGHYLRVLPTGYMESLASGENHIEDENLSKFYEKLTILTKGDLFDKKRLEEVWNMNTGKYDHFLHAYKIPISVGLNEISNPTPEGQKWDSVNFGRVFDDGGIHIYIDVPNSFNQKYFKKNIELNLESKNDYYIIYFNNGFTVAKQLFKGTNESKIMKVYTLEIPNDAVLKGYDAIRVEPLEGDGNYRLGHLQLS